MKDLTVEKLTELGFERVDVTPEESGDPEGFHYYVYELANGECLLTEANNEITDEFYNVEFLTLTDLGKYQTYNDVKRLIDSIKRKK